MVDTIVCVLQGALKGKKVLTKAGVTYYSFQGIPYAKPPIGPLRFKAPQPPEPWEGVRDALTEGAVAPHIDDFLTTDYSGEEDCLFLNVYTPQIPDSSSQGNLYLPVMMWIHGGGYYVGSGNSDFYGPDYLVAENVILVTINYRLGALGFLSTGDSVIPGNNGLKDQVMALRWIQQNIAYFGGDPGNVTIFGESAGAGSVHQHLLSPMSEGLFHKAIAQSGSALNPWAFEDSSAARCKAFRFTEAVGCKSSSSQEILDYLSKLPAKDLVEGMDKALTDEERHPLPLYFTPTNEKTSSGNEEIFLQDKPLNLLKLGKFHKVPLFMGVTSHEGMFVLKDVVENPDWFKGLNNEFKLPNPHGLNLKTNTDKYREIAERVKTFYFGSRPFSDDVWREFVDLYSDVWFYNPIIRAMKEHLKALSPIYFYEFSFDGMLGFADLWVGKARFPGVCHSDEIGYLFQTVTNNDKQLEAEDYNMITLARMIRMWTNFAKTGNPTPKPDPLLGVIWNPANRDEFKFLNIDKELSMKTSFQEDRMAFWDSLHASLEL